jgi:hypothetical protein
MMLYGFGGGKTAIAVDARRIARQTIGEIILPARKGELQLLIH